MLTIVTKSLLLITKIVTHLFYKSEISIKYILSIVAALDDSVMYNVIMTCYQ